MSFEIINSFILEYFYYIFIGLLFVYMILGRKGKDLTKRIPLFLVSLLFFAVLISAILTNQKNLPAYLPTVIFLLLFGTSFTMFKDRFFPYRLKCVKCGKWLTMHDILLDEGYVCAACKGEAESIEEASEEDDSENGDDETGEDQEK